MVRKGEVINEFTDKEDVDALKVVRLVEDAFSRTLERDWWEKVSLKKAYVSESYRAAAIITNLDDFTYLDKFAIHESAQGEGLARTVWDHLTRDHQDLFWRSRSDNKFNAFYAKEADGSVRQNHWTIFWRGEEDFDRISRAIKRLAEMPASFRRDSSGV